MLFNMTGYPLWVNGLASWQMEVCVQEMRKLNVGLKVTAFRNLRDRRGFTGFT
jgi:hypothetical protein